MPLLDLPATVFIKDSDMAKLVQNTPAPSSTAQEKTKTSDQDRFKNWGVYLPPEEYWLAVLVPPQLVGKPLNREQYLMYLESRLEQLIEDYPQGPDTARRFLNQYLKLGSQSEPFLDPGDSPGTWTAVLVGYSGSLGREYRRP